LQVDVVARLANGLGIELGRAEVLRAARERPDNPDAVDLAMRDLAAEFRFNPASNKKAIALCERAPTDVDGADAGTVPPNGATRRLWGRVGAQSDDGLSSPKDVLL
jgi:hypothetical protein